jgi:hypothetical protein
MQSCSALVYLKEIKLEKLQKSLISKQLNILMYPLLWLTVRQSRIGVRKSICLLVTS